MQLKEIWIQYGQKYLTSMQNWYFPLYLCNMVMVFCVVVSHQFGPGINKWSLKFCDIYPVVHSGNETASKSLDDNVNR